MAGHVGQVALERIADGGLAAGAELDQHVAAVRAELSVCQQPPGTGGRLAGPAANRGNAGAARLSRLTRLTRLTGIGRAPSGGRKGPRGHADHTSDLQARLGVLRSTTVTCPDVPFVSDALQAEATVPVTLLLHYATGFVQAGISSGWWPGQSADASDWVSLRLAAICKLISQAEAAGEAHPDLRATA
jgi:hypothetical protein